MRVLKRTWRQFKRGWRKLMQPGRRESLLPLLASLFILMSATANWSAIKLIIQPAAQHYRVVPVIGLRARPKPSPTPGPDCHQVACLALTFDDGPNPMTTPQVLTELEQFHVTASFFLVGTRIAGNEGLLQRMHADGDEIGNHSWSHPDFTKLTRAQIRQQIDLTQQAVIAASVPPPTLFRPPYGAINATVEANVPMTILLWNEDPEDWAATRAATVVQAVEASAKPGGIVDMHDIYHVTADALPQILTDLQARGFHFVTVSELLHLTPASRGLYYGH